MSVFTCSRLASIVIILVSIHGHGGGAPPHDGKNFGLPGTLKNMGGGPGGGWFSTAEGGRKFFYPPLGRPFFTKSPPRWKNFGQFLLINYPPGKKIFDHPPFPGAGPGGKFFGRRRRPKNFYPPPPPGGAPPPPSASMTLPMYDCKYSWKPKIRAPKCVETADFALLESQKLISHKIWVIGKSWNFHIVYRTPCNFRFPRCYNMYDFTF